MKEFFQVGMFVADLLIVGISLANYVVGKLERSRLTAAKLFGPRSPSTTNTLDPCTALTPRCKNSLASPIPTFHGEIRHHFSDWKIQRIREREIPIGMIIGVANRFGCRVVEREFPVASLIDPGKG